MLPLIEEISDLIGQGRFDEAMGDLTKVLDVQPNNGTAHYLTGQVLLHTRQYALARKEFAVSAMLLPEQPEIFNNIAEASIQLKDYDVALAAIDTSISIQQKKGAQDRDLAVDYAQRGTILALLQRMPEANEMFERAIANGSGNIHVVHHAANHFINTSNYGRAVALLEEEFQRGTRCDHLYFQHAIASILSENLDVAKLSLAVAISLYNPHSSQQPVKAKALAVLGDIYWSEERTEEAAQHYKAAIEAVHETNRPFSENDSAIIAQADSALRVIDPEWKTTYKVYRSSPHIYPLYAEMCETKVRQALGLTEKLGEYLAFKSNPIGMAMHLVDAETKTPPVDEIMGHAQRHFSEKPRVVVADR